jgi:hypothetical protein
MIWSLIAIVLLSCGIRFFTAGWGGLSCDEAYCVNIVQATSWSRMFTYIVEDGNAPLIYVIYRLWSTVFGTTDFAFRILAVFIASALAPVAYVIFRKQLGHGSALQLAVLLALCPPLVQFGVLVRGYGLLPLLSLLVTWQLMRIIDQPTVRRLSIYCLLIAATVYLHHWGAMLALGHATLMVVGLICKWWSREVFVRWLVAASVAALLYAPWAVIVAKQLRQDVSPWILKPSLVECLFLTPVEAVAGYREKYAILLYWNILWANVAYWCSLLIPVTINTGNVVFLSRPWQIITASGIAFAAIISQIRSIWRDRYLVAFSPIILLLYTVTAGKLFRQAPPWVAFCLPLAIWLITWIPQLWYFHNYPESSAWVLAEQVGKSADPHKDLVVVSFQAVAPQINRYIPENVRVVSTPDLERVMIFRWVGINERIRDDAKLLELVKLMKATLDAGGAVWVIESVHAFVPIPIGYPLDGMDFNAAEVARMCQVRTWLLQNAVKDKEDLWAPGREFPLMASRFTPKAKAKN